MYPSVVSGRDLRLIPPKSDVIDVQVVPPSVDEVYPAASLHVFTVQLAWG